MTNYLVRHRTTYHYFSNVAYSRLIAHLVPRRTARQRSQSVEVTIQPRPAQQFERTDFFGNVTSWYTIDEPHDTLEVLAESRVEIDPIPEYPAGESAAWESARALFAYPTDASALEALQYTFDTPLTATDEDVVAFARTSFKRGRALFEAVLELNARIYAGFRFDAEATNTRTTVYDAFALRAGVCQDLAHVGIACVRSMGLAARYVSGYLLTHPPPGRERLIGADASHAWFSVWIPPFGWVDFDPTNNMLPSSEHITVGWGRDYGDVAPIHGIITGGGENEVDVAVDVIPLADAANRASA
jgi:transglutaminase-like putative cysteine protease